MEPVPHGNSGKKDTHQYVQTWESMKRDLREESDGKYPREAIHGVPNKAMGGIQSCVSLGQIPRIRTG